MREAYYCGWSRTTITICNFRRVQIFESKFCCCCECERCGTEKKENLEDCEATVASRAGTHQHSQWTAGLVAHRLLLQLLQQKDNTLGQQERSPLGQSAVWCGTVPFLSASLRPLSSGLLLAPESGVVSTVCRGLEAASSLLLLELRLEQMI